MNRIVAYVGSYFVSLEGQVDALVFAGGIGERSSALRAEVVRKVACLGFGVDEGRNGAKMSDVVEDVSGQSTERKVLVCQTDEQFEMARACAAMET